MESNLPIIPLSPLKSIVLSVNSTIHDDVGFDNVNGNILDGFTLLVFSDSCVVEFSIFIDVLFVLFLSGFIELCFSSSSDTSNTSFLSIFDLICFCGVFLAFEGVKMEASSSELSDYEKYFIHNIHSNQIYVDDQILEIGNQQIHLLNNITIKYHTKL